MFSIYIMRKTYYQYFYGVSADLNGEINQVSTEVIDFLTMSAEKLENHPITGGTDWYLTAFNVALNGSQTAEQW